MKIIIKKQIADMVNGDKGNNYIGTYNTKGYDWILLTPIKDEIEIPLYLRLIHKTISSNWRKLGWLGLTALAGYLNLGLITLIPLLWLMFAISIVDHYSIKKTEEDITNFYLLSQIPIKRPHKFKKGDIINITLDIKC